MDQIDKHIILLLQMNSRITYREIAEKTELTVNAVHNRVKNFIDRGIIQRFTTRIDLIYAGGIRIYIYGSTKKTNFKEMGLILGKHECIFWVCFASGNQAFIGADLKNIEEMNDVLDYVNNILQLENAEVAIVNLPYSLSQDEISMSKRDYQILNSLRNDSRKALSEVAEELGISAKTVRNRLENIVDKSLVDFSIEWYPDLDNDIFNLILAEVKPEVEIQSFSQKLIVDYFPNVIFAFTLHNLPKSIMIMQWSNSMKEFEQFKQTLKMDKFEKFIPHTLHAGFLYNTWRDELLEERAKQ